MENKIVTNYEMGLAIITYNTPATSSPETPRSNHLPSIVPQPADTYSPPAAHTPIILIHLIVFTSVIYCCQLYQ